MPIREIVAVLWLAAFLVYFFQFDLPNFPGVNRAGTLLVNLPELLVPARARVADPEAAQIAQRSGWRYLPQRAGLLLVAACIFAGSWGWGGLALRAIGVSRSLTSLERTVFACGIGLFATSLATLLCGLAGALSRPLCGAGLACGLAGELWARWRTRNSGAPGAEPLMNAGQIRRRSRAAVWWLCATAPFVGCMLLGALLPEIDFDVKEYHFQGPKEWYLAGRIEFLPHNVYTSFPFLTEMLTLLGMVLYGDWYWGALAGKGVLMTFAPLTALGLYAAGRRWFSPTAGALAAFIHLSTPWIYRISIIAYAEGGLTFYLCAALLAVMLGIDRLVERPVGETGTVEGDDGHRPTLRLFFLAGMLAGSAMACKYPGAVSVVFPMGVATMAAPFLVLPRSPQQRVTALRGGAIFALGVSLTIGPWLVKNALQTGNPVYPLLYSVFDGRDWDAALDAKWRRGHSPDNYRLDDLGAKVIDVTAKSDWLSPLLYGLAPLAWLATLKRHRVAWLWAYILFLFAGWWLLTHRLDRFWVPMIPVVSLLGGVGATWSESRLWKWLAGSAIVVCGLFNFAFMTTTLCGYNAYFIDLELAREKTAELTSPEIALLNRSLPAGSKVLCVGDAEVFDARFPLVYNTVFDRSIFAEWCAAPKSGLRPPAEIREAFRKAGVTHVYVNWQEILRYRRTYGYTDFVTPARFDALRRMGILDFPWAIPGGQPLSQLTPAEQEEIRHWAPELIKNQGDEEVFTTFQVFPVIGLDGA